MMTVRKQNKIIAKESDSQVLQNAILIRLHKGEPITEFAGLVLVYVAYSGDAEKLLKGPVINN